MHYKSRENTVVDLFVSIAGNATITTQSNRDLFVSLGYLEPSSWLHMLRSLKEREKERKKGRQRGRERGRKERTVNQSQYILHTFLKTKKYFMSHIRYIVRVPVPLIGSSFVFITGLFESSLLN